MVEHAAPSADGAIQPVAHSVPCGKFKNPFLPRAHRLHFRFALSEGKWQRGEARHLRQRAWAVLRKQLLLFGEKFRRRARMREYMLSRIGITWHKPEAPKFQACFLAENLMNPLDHIAPSLEARCVPPRCLGSEHRRRAG